MTTHLTTVVYRRRLRDLWRKTYWVRCWTCEGLELGPITDRGLAWIVAKREELREHQCYSPVPWTPVRRRPHVGWPLGSRRHSGEGDYDLDLIWSLHPAGPPPGRSTTWPTSASPAASSTSPSPSASPSPPLSQHPMRPRRRSPSPYPPASAAVVGSYVSALANAGGSRFAYWPGDRVPEPEPELEPAPAAIPAVKAARLCPVAVPGPWMGIGVMQGYASPDAYAVCSAGGGRREHAGKAPAWDCSCGFYAIGDVAELQTYYGPSGDVWELEVALWGRVIEHESGYRAERQRVLKARPPRYCDVCGAPNKRAEYLAERVDGFLVGVCHQHAIADRSRLVLAGAVEELIGCPLDAPESFRTGPPPPDMAALLERIAAAVERWGGDFGGGSGPAFPKDWHRLFEGAPTYSNMMVVPTNNPAYPLRLEVTNRPDHLELRFIEPSGCHHLIKLPYRTA